METVTEIEYVWVEDRGYRLALNGDRCSQKGCATPAVMTFSRWRRRSNGFYLEVRVRWGCCAEHSYGRRIVDGRILVAVHPDSIAAKRGYTEAV